MEAVVCGIDPGVGTTGYAVVSRRGITGEHTVVDAGVCRYDRRQTLAERLARCFDDISGLLDEHRPHLVAVEQLFSHYKHPRTAILMGHARGVILHAAVAAGCEVVDFSATRIKRYLTGNGRASKAQMQRAVQAMLGLAELPEPHDLADALAIAVCGIDAWQRRAVEGVSA